MASDNVDRLVEAGVLDDKKLTTEDRDKINSIDLSDNDISVLTRIKEELGLEKLEWTNLNPDGLNYL